jgi:hypothetical protein
MNDVAPGQSPSRSAPRDAAVREFGFFDEWRGSFGGVVTMWTRRLFNWGWLRCDLHKFVGPDAAHCYHSHPAWAVRIVLRGGYVEEYEDGRYRMRRAGYIGLIRPRDTHRIAGLRNGHESWSLWLRFKKVAEVRLVGAGWEADRNASEDRTEQSEAHK